MSGDEICDFVWQHQYHKNWVTYSDKESALLNRAVRKWQKNVSLPSKDNRKKVIVHLDDMQQVNQVSSVIQPIRCLIYSDNFYSWLWKDDYNIWCSYKPRIAFFLEVAYQRKENIFKFYDHNDYLVNLGTFIQVNEQTNFIRHVLRQKVDLVLPLKQFNHALKNEEFKNVCLNKSINFGKRCINLPALSSSLCSMSSELEASNIPDVSFISSEDETELYECKLPPDYLCTDRKNFHIYCEAGSAFSATLSFASTASNHNKFCIIQVLKKHNTMNEYYIWKRSGRVGTKGIMNLQYFSSRENAKNEFEVLFYEKTNNVWKNRNNFVKYPESHDLLDVDLNPDVEKNAVAVDLNPLTESLLEKICDRKVMATFMKEMLYDSNLPLGKLTVKQIKQGYIALNKIAQAAANYDAGIALVNACDEFYTKIPHDFGNKCPLLIQTKEDIQGKITMLETLTNIRIATLAMDSKPDVIEHPLNKYFNSLKYELKPLDPSCSEYTAIEHYLQNTHGPTHKFTMDVISIFKCYEKEQSSFINLENKMLLWHGSRITNWAGILKQGLRIPPPEAPNTGRMFGKGLYFADASSKSANYCCFSMPDREGLLLICEVSLGKQLYLTEPDESLPASLSACFDSVFGRGRITPKDYQCGVLSSDAKEPIGRLVRYDNVQTRLNYNEYVVYNANFVKMRYLLRIKFDW